MAKELYVVVVDTRGTPTSTIDGKCEHAQGPV
jgi:hypothetical protein